MLCDARPRTENSAPHFRPVWGVLSRHSASSAHAVLACAGVHAGVSRLTAPARSDASRPGVSVERLLTWRGPFIEELLNRLEHLHAVLLHHDRVRAFAYLHVALVGRI